MFILNSRDKMGLLYPKIKEEEQKISGKSPSWSSYLLMRIFVAVQIMAIGVGVCTARTCCQLVERTGGGDQRGHFGGYSIG